MNDIIEAISCEKEIIQLKLLNVPKHPKMIAKIFSILKDEEINVDMISQVTVDDFVQIEITLDQEFQLKLNQAMLKKILIPNIPIEIKEKIVSHIDATFYILESII